MNVPLVPLKDVVVTKTGSRNPSATPDMEFDYVDVASVDNAEKRITGARRMVGKDAPSRARKLIRTRDVLLATIRPNLNAVALVPPSLDGEVASTGFCVLRARDAVLPEYLFYFCRSAGFVGELCKLVAGAMYPAVTDSQVLDQRIPMRELGEQRRIVDVLSRAEGIVRLRREAAAKAAELIPALFIHHFGDPATNPMGWPQCTLGDVVNIASGGTPSKARPDFWEGDLPWVSPKDMKRTVIVDAIDHISPKVVEETNLKLVPKDAVLIVVRGMILAHTVPIAITARPVTINQDMKALTAKEGVMPAFLLWHLKVMHHELLGATSTAAHGTKKLETKDLLRQPVVVPPLALQGQFCEQMMAMESIQRQQIDALAKAQATFDALLAQAFAPT